MRSVIRIIKVVGLFYLILCLALFFLQKRILFQPETLAKDFQFQFDTNFEEFNLKTNDGIELNGLHFKTEAPKGVILYFHGNRGSLRRWGSIVTFFVNKNYDVVIMDYRGYGKNDGTITEALLYEDAQLFYDYTKDKYPEDQIIVYGRSLGTGIGAKTAAANHPKHLVLETPYYSIKDVASRWYPWLPTGPLLRFNIPSYQFVNNVRCPITVFHGTADGVIPYESGKHLYEYIKQEHKEMITIPEGEHNNLINYDLYHSGIDTVL